MGRWLKRVAAENRTVQMAHAGTGPVFGSTSPDLRDIRHTPICRPCGRPQHHPDVICGPGLCPSWADPDPAYPIAPGYFPKGSANV